MILVCYKTVKGTQTRAKIQRKNRIVQTRGTE